MKTLIATIACLLLASQAQAQTCCGTRSGVLFSDPVYAPQQFLLAPAPALQFSYTRTEFLAPQTFSYGVQSLGVGGCGTGLRLGGLGVGANSYGFGFRDPLFIDRGFRFGGAVRVRTPGVSVFIR